MRGTNGDRQGWSARHLCVGVGIDTFWSMNTPAAGPTSETPFQDYVAMLAEDAVQHLRESPGQRYMLGITGGPGAGKSTFADALALEINALFGSDVAIVVPMDGFHKTNRELVALNMWERKGDPETFDAAGFGNLLSRIHDFPDRILSAPRFDRVTDEPVPAAIHIQPSHRFVIVEGNYLLLPTNPWSGIQAIFDDVWYLEAPQDVVIARLRERHLLRGLTGTQLDEKIALSDLRNGERIAASRHSAGRILALPIHRE